MSIWSSLFGAKKLLADVKDVNIPWTALTGSEEQLRAKYQWFTECSDQGLQNNQPQANINGASHVSGPQANGGGGASLGWRD